MGVARHRSTRPRRTTPTMDERAPLVRRERRDGGSRATSAAAACAGVALALGVALAVARASGRAVAPRALGQADWTATPRATPTDGTHRLRSAGACARASASAWAQGPRNYCAPATGGGYACDFTCAETDLKVTTKRMDDGNYTLSTGESLCSVTSEGAFSCALALLGSDDSAPDAALFDVHEFSAYVGAEEPSARCLRERSYTIKSVGAKKFCVDDGVRVSCSSDAADTSARWFFVDAASCPPLESDGI